MLIHIDSLMVKEAARKERSGLTAGIFIDADRKRAFATDGTVLVETPINSGAEFDEANFPIIDGMEKTKEPKGITFIPIDIVEEIWKFLKANKKVNYLPILQCAQIKKQKKKENNTPTIIGVTNLSSYRIFKITEEANAPEIDRAHPKGKPRIEIHFSKVVLGKVLKSVPEDSTIKLFIFAPDKAVKFETKDIKGLAMPCV